MVRPSSVQDAGDLVDLLLRIAGPSGTSVVCDSPENGQQAECDDGFFVDDVELVADGSHAQACSCREHGSFRDGAVSWDGYRVEQRLGLLLRILLRHIGVVAGWGDLGRDGWEGSERERWAETSGACCG